VVAPVAGIVDFAAVDLTTGVLRHRDVIRLAGKERAEEILGARRITQPMVGRAERSDKLETSL
jgi:hypothetical protein